MLTYGDLRYAPSDAPPSHSRRQNGELTMAKRMKREDRPIFMPYTCPGCEKRGSVGFTLGSLPFDFICSSCGMPSHLRKEDDRTVTLTFDTDTFIPPSGEKEHSPC